MVNASTDPKIGTATKKIHDSSALMENAMMDAEINIIGARTRVRITIIKAFCRLVISVVIRVMSEDVLNLSILEKEKSCTR